MTRSNRIFAVFIVQTLMIYSYKNSNAQPWPVPTPQQLRWQQMETTAFLHFTVNTYTGKEWGDGTESPAIFNPVKFNARQWMKTLKDAGFKMAIITAKHHDGFCLWPSKFTNHSVKSSPWKNGKGDVVKEVSDACREYGLAFGFYLSPWDRHEPSYGTPAYNDYYIGQLQELLTNYGKVSEVWFDGAKGEGEKAMDYKFQDYWNLVRKLQPEAVIFSDAGPDVRWVGNESGNSGSTNWSTINNENIVIGKADTKYLNTGDPEGKKWIPTETDVSIRKGWFHHPEEDDSVRSPQDIVDLYYKSVGRNSVLLLNVPPTRDGLLHETDVRNLLAYRKILDETFSTNLAVKSNNRKLTDAKLETFETVAQGGTIELLFAREVTFDRVVLQENITHGQHIAEGNIEYWDGQGWKLAEKFTTIGYKRILRLPVIKTKKVRLTNMLSKQPLELAELGLYKASSKERN